MESCFKSLNNFKNSMLRIQALDEACINQHWSLQQWQDICGHWESHKVAITEAGGEIVNFALWQVSDPRCSYLLKIATDKAFERKGFSFRVLERANLEFKRSGFETSYLEVETKNHAAISLYQKLGYEILHLKKAYYSDGADAYAMQLKLN